MNLVNLAIFAESGCIYLKLNESDKLVKGKLSRNEVFIKIVEIIINIDLHLFSPVFTKSIQMYYKYRIHTFIILYLWNPDSSVRIQTYLLRSYNCIHKYHTRHPIFAYLNSSVRIQ